MIARRGEGEKGVVTTAGAKRERGKKGPKGGSGAPHKEGKEGGRDGRSSLKSPVDTRCWSVPCQKTDQEWGKRGGWEEFKGKRGKRGKGEGGEGVEWRIELEREGRGDDRVQEGKGGLCAFPYDAASENGARRKKRESVVCPDKKKGQDQEIEGRKGGLVGISPTRKGSISSVGTTEADRKKKKLRIGGARKHSRRNGSAATTTRTSHDTEGGEKQVNRGSADKSREQMGVLKGGELRKTKEK